MNKKIYFGIIIIIGIIAVLGVYLLNKNQEGLSFDNKACPTGYIKYATLNTPKPICVPICEKDKECPSVPPDIVPECICPVEEGSNCSKDNQSGCDKLCINDSDCKMSPACNCECINAAQECKETGMVPLCKTTRCRCLDNICQHDGYNPTTECPEGYKSFINLNHPEPICLPLCEEGKEYLPSPPDIAPQCLCPEGYIEKWRPVTGEKNNYSVWSCALNKQCNLDDQSGCDISCDTKEDCQSTCACGCVNKNQECDNLIECEAVSCDCVDHKCKEF